jgi:hypothetical protein
MKDDLLGQTSGGLPGLRSQRRIDLYRPHGGRNRGLALGREIPRHRLGRKRAERYKEG